MLQHVQCYALTRIGLIFLFFYLFLTRTRDEPQRRVKVGATPPSLTLDSDILRVTGAQPHYTLLYYLLTYSLISFLIFPLSHYSAWVYLTLFTRLNVPSCIYTVPLA